MSRERETISLPLLLLPVYFCTVPIEKPCIRDLSPYLLDKKKLFDAHTYILIKRSKAARLSRILSKKNENDVISVLFERLSKDLVMLGN